MLSSFWSSPRLTKVIFGTPKGPQFYEAGENTQQVRSLSPSALWGRSKSSGTPREDLLESKSPCWSPLQPLLLEDKQVPKTVRRCSWVCCLCPERCEAASVPYLFITAWLAGRIYPIKWNAFPICVGHQIFVCSVSVGVLCYTHFVLWRQVDRQRNRHMQSQSIYIMYKEC